MYHIFGLWKTFLFNHNKPKENINIRPIVRKIQYIEYIIFSQNIKYLITILVFNHNMCQGKLSEHE